MRRVLTALATTAVILAPTPAHADDIDPLEAAMAFPQHLQTFINDWEAQILAERQAAREAAREAKAAREAAASQPSRDYSGGVSTSSSGLNWDALAACESGGNPTIVSSNGLWFGLYQFTIGTWQGVGGTGLPTEASAEEQTMRAQILYDRAGDGPWPNCGYHLYD